MYIIYKKEKRKTPLKLCVFGRKSKAGGWHWGRLVRKQVQNSSSGAKKN